MHGEISVGGVTYIWYMFGHILTVTAPDGRQQKTQLGGSSPESLVRLLAIELDEQQPK